MTSEGEDLTIMHVRGCMTGPDLQKRSTHWHHLPHHLRFAKSLGGRFILAPPASWIHDHCRSFSSLAGVATYSCTGGTRTAPGPTQKPGRDHMTWRWIGTKSITAKPGRDHMTKGAGTNDGVPVPCLVRRVYVRAGSGRAGMHFVPDLASYNLYSSTCLFSRNSIFLSQ